MAEKGTIIDSENFSDDPATNLQRFTEVITRKLKSADNFNKLKTLLIETGAVIAGGSVLNAVTNYFINDIDVYVPCKNSIAFNNRIKEMIFPTEQSKRRGLCILTEASKYCRSFLRRNGIRRIHSFQTYRSEIIFDVMSVRNKRAITDVVTNFDLTCCQVWYDGTNIRASHPDHIRDKVGYLQGDYVPLYINGNHFLRKRVQKYARRFKIKINYNIDDVILDADKTICKPPINRDDEHYKSWYTSEILYYIFNNKKHTNNNDALTSSSSGNSGRRKFGTRENFMLPNDGYDSEDYDDDVKLNEVIISNNLPSIQKYVNNPELKIAHVRRNFIFMLIDWRNTTLDSHNKINNYIDWCINNTIRKGRCVITLNDNVTIWDLHEHDLDQGISQEGLTEYLEDHIGDNDKSLRGELNVVCYSEGCQKRLNDIEITTIIKDKDLINKLRDIKPPSIKVDTDLHEITLQNTKSADPSFGSIYHYTICPFCLAQENRDSGCLYVAHKVASDKKAPYCESYNKIPDIVTKYNQLPNAQGYPNGKYQFCSECGRACWEHKHIKLDASGFETYVQGAPEDTPFNKCTGGGRAELFARMLAIRKVLTEQQFADDFEQRKACALAADIAPLDPVLMARANEILAKNPETRMNQNLLTSRAATQGGKTRRRINRKASRRASKS
jgi:hypothetical protein